MNATVPPLPCQAGSAEAFAKRSTNTPLGIRTASPPICATNVRLAASDTAMRAPIFSRAGSRIG